MTIPSSVISNRTASKMGTSRRLWISICGLLIVLTCIQAQRRTTMQRNQGPGHTTMQQNQHSGHTTMQQNQRSGHTTMQRNQGPGHTTMQHNQHSGHATMQQNQRSGHTTIQQNQNSGHATMQQNQHSGHATMQQNQHSGHATMQQNQNSGHATMQQNQRSGHTTMQQNQNSGHATMQQNQHSGHPTTQHYSGHISVQYNQNSGHTDMQYNQHSGHTQMHQTDFGFNANRYKWKFDEEAWDTVNDGRHYAIKIDVYVYEEDDDSEEEEGSQSGEEGSARPSKVNFISQSTSPEFRLQNPSHNSRVCSTFGYYHYKTFDGDIFHYRGDCNYVLASHCKTNYEEFNIQIRRTEKDNVPVISNIYMKVEGTDINISDKNIKVNGEEISLPYSLGGIQISKTGTYIRISSKLGLELLWNEEDSIVLELSPKFANQTCGLCGDFNGIPIYNEFIINNVQLKEEEYGSLHRYNMGAERCEEIQITEEEKKCEMDTKHICTEILTSPAFRECNRIVDVSKYIELCEKDMCRCTGNSTGFCLCNIFAEYSRQCTHAGGRPKNWRNSEVCPLKCGFNMAYRECGTACPDTCTNPERSSVCDDHCTDGCFCPAGLVFDDINRSGCIRKEECACKYNGEIYATGTGYSEQCQTCTCLGGKWSCEKKACFGTCSLEGGSHITTFDLTRYNFHGDCTYIMTKSCDSSLFSILVELHKCGMTDTETCLKSLTLSLLEGKDYIFIKKCGSVYVNSIYSQLPISTSSATIFKPTSHFLIVQTKFGLQIKVQLVPDMQIHIRADPSLMNKLCGLCGNFNNIQADDFKSPSGVIEGTGASFGNLWRTQGDCLSVKNSFEDPCALSQESETYATYWCSLLKNSDGPFSACHKAVDPEVYYKNCLFDACNCEKSEACMCTALSSYVYACSREGIHLRGWRTDVCNVYTTTCPETFKYSYTVSTCMPTCRSLSEPDVTCEIEFVPVDGCICEDGTYLDETGKCVLPALCPCFYKGSALSPGEVIHDKGAICTCKNGVLECLGVNVQEKVCEQPMVYFDCAKAPADAKGSECQKTCSTIDKECYSSQCVSGCMCPDGLVLHEDGDCVPESYCPCVHNDEAYAAGEKIKVQCNTCTCQDRKWDCTNNTCLATCAVYGDGHYLTFDRKRFSFNGACQYTLAQDYCSEDASAGTFRIITENVPCGTTGTTCSKEIRLYLGNYEMILGDQKFHVIKRDHGQYVPFKARQMGVFIVIEAANGIVLVWDKKTTIFMKLAPHFQGKVCGLCGNYDGNAMSDFVTRSKSVVGDVVEFGNSWKLSPHCPNALAAVDSCSSNPYRKAWSQKQCSIITGPIFHSCHPLVDPVQYYEACVNDACACDSGGDCECFCTAVAAYAQACSEAGECITWRTPSMCPIFCDFYNRGGQCEWHYKACGAPCMKTCMNPTGTCYNNLLGLEGCYPKCPEDRPYFDENSMACVSSCNCFDEYGQEYKSGEKMPGEHKCSLCYCTKNGRECTDESVCCFYEDKEFSPGEIIYSTVDGIGGCIYAVCSENSTIERVIEPCATTVSPTPAFTFSTPSSISPSEPSSSSTGPPESTVSSTGYTSTASPSSLPGTSTSSTPSSPSTSSAESTPVPTVIPTICYEAYECKWSEWYDVSNPGFGADDGDFETFTNIRAKGYKVCENPKSVQCRAKQYPDEPLEDLKQDISCSKKDGLICLNSKNSPICHNFEIRIECCQYKKCATTSEEPSTQFPLTSIPTTTEVTTITGKPSPPGTSQSTSSSVSTEKPTTSSVTEPGSSTPEDCKTFKVSECRWTDWYNEDKPSTDIDGEEKENLDKLRAKGIEVCSKEEVEHQIECQAEKYPDLAYENIGQVSKCNLKEGLVCQNKDQTTDTKECHDYKIRIECCSKTYIKFCGISPASTPKPSTTSPSSSTSTSTSSTETPGKTPVPGIVTGSPSLPSSAEIITAATATSLQTTTCVKKMECRWTAWYDNNAPTIKSDGGDSESIQDTKSRGIEVCKKQEFEKEIECEAIDKDGSVIADNQQQVTCDIENGLLCSNREQQKKEKCNNYRIRVECCAEYCEKIETPVTIIPETTTSTTSVQEQKSTGTPQTSTLSSIVTQSPSTSAVTEPGSTTPEGCEKFRASECHWSDWFNEDKPSSDIDGEDNENLENLRAKGIEVCHKDEIENHIECKAQQYSDLAYENIDQVYKCNIKEGLVCKNIDQTTDDRQCHDFKIRFECCSKAFVKSCGQPTTTPLSSTSTEETTIPITTSVSETSLPGTETTPPSTSSISTSSTEIPGITSETTSPSGTGTTPTTLTTSSTEIGTSTIATSLPSTPCVEKMECRWTPWYDNNAPNAKSDGGDIESPEDTKSRGIEVCTNRESENKIECEAIDKDGLTITNNQQVVTCDLKKGLECWNKDQNKKEKCHNYRIRVECCALYCEPIKTTVSTESTPTQTGLTSQEIPQTSTPASVVTQTPSTTSVTEPGFSTPESCEKRRVAECQWTNWFNEDTPSSDIDGEDNENTDKLRANGIEVCKKEEVENQIECQAEEYPDLAFKDIGQVSKCTVKEGLVCKNNDQTDGKKCYNYKIRIECCSEDFVESCGEAIIFPTSTLSTKVTESPSTTSSEVPGTSTSETSFPPGTETQTSTPTSTSSTETTGITSSAPTYTNCEKLRHSECRWTVWFNEEKPSKDIDGEDNENIDKLTAKGIEVCRPEEVENQIECQAEQYPDLAYEAIGQVSECSVKEGLVCKNINQKGDVKECLDYKIRIECCSKKFVESCGELYTTPASPSSTEKTELPFTTSVTEISSPSSTTSTSTEVPGSKSPVPSTAIAYTSSPTTSASCEKLRKSECRWTDWFNEETPSKDIDGEDNENIDKLAAKGIEVCRPEEVENQIECQAEQYPDLAYEAIGQVSECSVKEGLVCKNSNQKGDVKECLDYKIRIECCSKKFVESCGELYTTPASPSSTEKTERPFTTSVTEISSPSSTTSTSTEVPGSKSPVPSTAIAYTSSPTTSASCEKLRKSECRWTDWFNEETPSKDIDGEDNENIDNLTAKGIEVCRPEEVENQIECQAEQYPDLAYEAIGQVSECSVKEGLVCKNSNQKGDVKECLDYKIRIECCSKKFVESCGELYTTPASPSSTEKTERPFTTSVTEISSPSSTTSTSTEVPGSKSPVPSTAIAYTSSPTTSASCEKLRKSECRWTDWFNEETPSKDIDGEDNENIDNLTAKGIEVCRPEEVENQIECQAEQYPDLAYEAIGQVSECSVKEGLVCKNSNQKGDVKECLDYKIRIECCSKKFVESCGELYTTPASPSSTEKTERPFTTSVTEITSPSSTTSTSTEVPGSKSPVPSTAIAYTSSPTTSASCEKLRKSECRWTDWFNEETPSKDIDGEDNENIDNLTAKGIEVCRPEEVENQIECQAEQYPDLAYEAIGQVSECSVKEGLVCKNINQKGDVKECLDYKIRIECCSKKFVESCGELYTTPASPSSTEKTERPFTTSVTEISSPSSTTSTSTEVPGSKSPVPSTAIAYTSSPTTSASCEKLRKSECRWTDWFNEETPSKDIDGEDNENIENLTAKGIEVCRPDEVENQIECQAEQYPDLAYEAIGQVSECSVKEGLVCKNINQKGDVKECLDYKIRIECCSKKFVESCGKLYTTPASPSSTEKTERPFTTSVTEISSPSSTTSTSTEVPGSKSPVPSTAIAYTSSPTTSASCEKLRKSECRWTDWFNEETPSKDIDGEDNENIDKLTAKGIEVCRPEEVENQIECQAEQYPDLAYEAIGQVSECSVKEGLVCKNINQKGDVKECLDYKIRIECCSKKFVESCGKLYTTPALPSSTEKTEHPFTTSVTETSSPGSTTSSSTEVPGSKSPVPSTAIAYTSSPTTSASCEKLRKSECRWTDWFNEETPSKDIDGEDNENIDNLRAKGIEVCRPDEVENQIECQAEQYPDLAYEAIGQVSKCSVKEGLICQNRNQKGDVQECLDYKIRIECCSKKFVESCGKLYTTPASPSSTEMTERPSTSSSTTPSRTTSSTSSTSTSSITVTSTSGTTNYPISSSGVPTSSTSTSSSTPQLSTTSKPQTGVPSSSEASTSPTTSSGSPATSSPSSTSISPTSCVCKVNDEFYSPGEIIYRKQDKDGCEYFAICSETCEPERHIGPCTPTSSEETFPTGTSPSKHVPTTSASSVLSITSGSSSMTLPTRRPKPSPGEPGYTSAETTSIETISVETISVETTSGETIVTGTPPSKHVPTTSASSVLSITSGSSSMTLPTRRPKPSPGEPGYTSAETTSVETISVETISVETTSGETIGTGTPPSKHVPTTSASSVLSITSGSSSMTLPTRRPKPSPGEPGYTSAETTSVETISVETISVETTSGETISTGTPPSKHVPTTSASSVLSITSGSSSMTLPTRRPKPSPDELGYTSVETISVETISVETTSGETIGTGTPPSKHVPTTSASSVLSITSGSSSMTLPTRRPKPSPGEPGYTSAETISVETISVETISVETTSGETTSVETSGTGTPPSKHVPTTSASSVLSITSGSSSMTLPTRRPKPSPGEPGYTSEETTSVETISVETISVETTSGETTSVETSGTGTPPSKHVPTTSASSVLSITSGSSSMTLPTRRPKPSPGEPGYTSAETTSVETISVETISVETTSGETTSVETSGTGTPPSKYVPTTSASSVLSITSGSSSMTLPTRRPKPSPGEPGYTSAETTSVETISVETISVETTSGETTSVETSSTGTPPSKYVPTTSASSVLSITSGSSSMTLPTRRPKPSPGEPGYTSVETTSEEPTSQPGTPHTEETTCGPCECLMPTCGTGYRVVSYRPPGACCATITCEPDSVCVFENTVYQRGAIIPQPKDSCLQCECAEDVKEKSGLYAVRCQQIVCDDNCQEGYAYVEKEGQCCGECKPKQCTMKGEDGTQVLIKVGETYYPDLSTCNHYECDEEDGKPILVKVKKVCQELDISTCEQDTLKYDEDGCCQTCTRKQDVKVIEKPTVIEDCSARKNLTILKEDDCEVEVELTYCGGPCMGSSIYSMESQDIDHKCTCCTELEVGERQVELLCANGQRKSYTYIDVLRCGCARAVCTPFSESEEQQDYTASQQIKEYTQYKQQKQ